MKNKYDFFKKLFKEYVIVFDYNGKRKSLGFDKYLMKYIKRKDINYIVVYNDFSIEIHENEINNYNKYLIIVFLKYLLYRKNW